MNRLIFAMLALFWGGSFVAIRVVVEALPPMFSAFVRVLLALGFLTLFYLQFKWPFSVPKRYLGKVWLIGLFMQGIPFAFLFWGEKFVSAGLAGILCGTVPIWVLVLGFFALRSDEPITPRKIGGVAFGFFGIIVIFSPSLSDTTSPELFWGICAVVAMAISYAIGGVGNRILLTGKVKLNRYGSLYQQTVSSVLFLGVLTLLIEGMPGQEIWVLSSEVWLSLLYLSFFSNALAWLMYFILLQEWGVLRAASVTYVMPIVAVGIDFLYFSNIPSVTELWGALLIFSGIVLIQWRSRAKKGP